MIYDETKATEYLRNFSPPIVHQPINPWADVPFLFLFSPLCPHGRSSEGLHDQHHPPSGSIGYEGTERDSWMVSTCLDLIHVIEPRK